MCRLVTDVLETQGRTERRRVLEGTLNRVGRAGLTGNVAPEQCDT